MKFCSPNVKRLWDALTGQYPVVDATETSAPSHLYLVSSTSPYMALKTIVINVRWAFPTFGFETHECVARRRAYLISMAPTSTGSALRGW
jgi:hypothetical protein